MMDQTHVTRLKIFPLIICTSALLSLVTGCPCPPGAPAPRADAGIDQTVGEGSLVLLPGGNSADPDGGPLSFDWTQLPGGVQVSVNGVFLVEPSFAAPQVTGDDIKLEFELTVTNEHGCTDTDTVVITVTDLDPDDPCNDVVCNGDGRFCNGSEFCDNGACLSSGNPCPANEICDEDTDECMIVLPPTNMVSWWAGDGNAEDIEDSNDGTLLGGATFAPGLIGQAFKFDGIDDYVHISDAQNLDLSSGEFTISLWVKPDSCPTSPSVTGPLVIKESASEFDAYTLNLFEGGFGYTVSTNAANWDTDLRGGSCTVGTWHHVSVVQGGGTATLYADGVAVAIDDTVSAPLNTNLPLQLGHREDILSAPGLQPNYFGGLMDEIQIFGRALTSEEIGAIFEVGNALR